MRSNPWRPAALGLTLMLLPGTATAQAGAQPMSVDRAEMISDAESAGPPEITGEATIVTWPEMEGGEPTVLREGTNEWTCFASSPGAQMAAKHDPMCADEAGLEFLTAFAEQREPEADHVSVIYMFQGDAGASNTDPFATEETPDNDWVQAGPHVMVVSPDPALLEGISTDPESGGPWLMWSGTPWAHVMVPVQEGSGPGR